ncbi:hypothetical protein ACXWRS_12095, partial [Streptococcus pyogenes]
NRSKYDGKTPRRLTGPLSSFLLYSGRSLHVFLSLLSFPLPFSSFFFSFLFSFPLSFPFPPLSPSFPSFPPLLPSPLF